MMLMIMYGDGDGGGDDDDEDHAYHLSGVIFGQPGAMLSNLGAILEPFWGHLGAI